MSQNANYSKPISILVYAFTGLCGAGLFKVSPLGMAFVTGVCILQGLVMTHNTKWHIYLRRLIGSLFPALLIVFLYRFVPVSDTPYQLASAMFMPIASGTTFMEGICHSHKPSGRKMVLEGVLIGLCLELGAFIAIGVGGFLGWL